MPAKTQPAIEIRSEWSPDLAAALDRRIYDYNCESTGFRDGTALLAELRDESGGLIGGVSGHTWGGCCELLSLWVHESHRNRGLGSALLAAAESAAAARGCSQVVVATHSFQAPRFYERRGYANVGAIGDYPRGHAKLFYVKQLAGPEQSEGDR